MDTDSLLLTQAAKARSSWCRHPMSLVPQDDIELEGPDDRWHEQWVTVAEEPNLNYSQAAYTAAILKGIVSVMVESSMPYQKQRGRWDSFTVASHRIGRWIRNGLVTVPHNIAYLAMFQRGLQGIPLRLESDHCWALAMWPVWRHSRSPRHRGGTIPLHPQLGWKFHDSKFYIWLVHCYTPSTQKSAWHIGGAQ